MGVKLVAKMIRRLRTNTNHRDGMSPQAVAENTLASTFPRFFETVRDRI